MQPTILKPNPKEYSISKIIKIISPFRNNSYAISLKAYANQSINYSRRKLKEKLNLICYTTKHASLP
jgi:hypothetical protein